MTGVEALEKVREIAGIALKDIGSSDEPWEDLGKRFMLALTKIHIMSGFYAEIIQRPPQ